MGTRIARTLLAVRVLLFLAAVAAMACGGAEQSPAPEGGGSNDGGRDATRWTASAQQAGPVRIGMTAAEAEAALGVRFAPLAAPGECVYRQSPVAPDGVLFMETAGAIARIDVTAPGVPTESGIEVGASEARVRTVYGARLSIAPHKYTDGRYLTVAADPDHRIVFETDGERLTRYRVGRLPEVEWVEGCS